MIDRIKSLLLNGKKLIIPSRTNKKFLLKYDLWDFINSSFDSSFSLQEKIYCLTHDLSTRPLCKICKTPLKFKYNYGIYCSRSCANKDPEIINKNSLSVSKSLKKIYSENGDFIKKKRNKTLYKKYGINVKSPFEIKEIKEKAENTLLVKYGVRNIFSLKEYRDNGKNKKENSINQWCVKGYKVEYLDTNSLKIFNACEKHPEFKIDAITFYNRAARNRNGVICPICNPLNSFSSFESEFEEILRDLKINYLKNDRLIIKPEEIDFFIPEFNLAIELNGIYWHSEIYKNKKYHLNKLKKCEERGIQLIQIWEDDFYNKKEIIKSLISNKLNKTENIIFARKTYIREIGSYEYKEFLIKNHLQGAINSSIKIGLFYSDQLVSVMGFGKNRISLGSKYAEGNYELHRFCSALNTVIVGGASKILTYFEKTYKPNCIITYAKRDYSNGKFYEKIGFKKEKECDPGYYWIINGCRKHRFSYRKDKIINESNKQKTEIEIMHEKGFIRAFDSGNLKYKKNYNFSS
jgi:very-short-patch-repair endonuclease